MPTAFHRRAPRSIALIDAILLHWLALGLLGLILVPSAHWHSPWIGWLPFWWVLMPGVLLLRHGFSSALRLSHTER